MASRGFRAVVQYDNATASSSSSSVSASALAGERRSITKLEPPPWDAAEKAAGRTAAEAETEAAAKESPGLTSPLPATREVAAAKGTLQLVTPPPLLAPVKEGKGKREDRHHPLGSDENCVDCGDL